MGVTAGGLLLCAMLVVVSPGLLGEELRTGPFNAITDVPGIEVGHHTSIELEEGYLTGTTVVLPVHGTVGGVDVRGAAPGTRETDLLDPVNMVNLVSATARPTASIIHLACQNADAGPVEQGNVGAGTGAVAGGYKGGIGTASVAGIPSYCDAFPDRCGW